MAIARMVETPFSRAASLSLRTAIALHLPRRTYCRLRLDLEGPEVRKLESVAGVQPEEERFLARDAQRDPRRKPVTGNDRPGFVGHVGPRHVGEQASSYLEWPDQMRVDAPDLEVF